MAKRAGLKKGYKFTSQHLICPECSREFKNPQGLYGHQAFVHGGSAQRVLTPEQSSPAGSAPQPHSAVSQEAVAQAEREVKLLELERRKAALTAGNPGPKHIIDVAEQAGLGPLTEASQSTLQGRAFNLAPNDKGQVNWLDVLSSPNLLPLLGIARRIMAPDGDNSGGVDGALDTLSRLGIDVKELLAGRISAPGDLNVAGLALGGASPAVIHEVLEFQLANDRMKANRELLAGLKPVAVEVIAEVRKLTSAIMSVRGQPAPGSGGRWPGQVDQPEQPGDVDQALGRCQCGQVLMESMLEASGDLTCPNCKATYKWEEQSQGEDSAKAEAEDKPVDQPTDQPVDQPEEEVQDPGQDPGQVKGVLIGEIPQKEARREKNGKKEKQV